LEDIGLREEQLVKGELYAKRTEKAEEEIATYKTKMAELDLQSEVLATENEASFNQESEEYHKEMKSKQEADN